MMANLNSREKIGQAARALEMNTFTSSSHGSQSRPAVQIIQNPNTFSTSVGHTTDMGRVRLDTSVIHQSDDGVLYNVSRMRSARTISVLSDDVCSVTLIWMQNLQVWREGHAG